jgi:LacI family transcriptional regulator
MQSAEALGYQANNAAKAIATGRFGSVALLLSTSPHISTLPQRVWEGIYDELATRDIHLSLFRLPDQDLTDERKMPKILREWMADGIIVDYTHRIPARMIELIERHRLPAVWFNTLRETDCVRPDDFGGAREATQRLIDNGHRRISYVDFFPADPAQENHYSVEARRSGYEAAMKDAGLECSFYQGDRATLTAGERTEWFAKVLNSTRRPTAIITYSSGDAQRALLSAERLGLEVPRDLSVITFGSQTRWFDGRLLSCFESPEYEMGRSVADMLLQKLENPEEGAARASETRTLPYAWKAGEMTATAPREPEPPSGAS